MKKQIPVFFAIDNGYAPFLAVALNSLVEHSKEQNDYNITVLYKDLKEENMLRLKKFERDNVKINFKNMKVNLDVFDDRKENRFRCDYIIAIYFRLFIASMFKDLDKAIYLDSDIVLNDDVAELYNIDIKDNLLGGCYDASISTSPILYGYTEQAVGVKKHEYINSGILLMNLKEMRLKNFEGHFLSLLNKYRFDTVAPDQDYINAICNGKIHYLDDRWDTMPNDNAPEISDAKIIHYNLFSKPWCYDNIQYADYFWKYAADSGYLNEAIENKRNYSEEQKENDAKCLGILVANGEKFCDNEITFKKMYDKGVKIRL